MRLVSIRDLHSSSPSEEKSTNIDLSCCYLSVQRVSLPLSLSEVAGKMLMETQHTEKVIHTKSAGKENGVWLWLFFFPSFFFFLFAKTASMKASVPV